MIGAIARFFAGEARILIKAPAHEAANLFVFSGVPVYDGTLRGDGYAVTVELRDKKLVKRLCGERGLECAVLWERGLLPFLKKAAWRPGLIVGALLSLLLLWQSSCYVWDLKIYGNERLTDEEVTEILRGHGFFVGCRHAALDLHALCAGIPIDDDRIAWISINMMGSVAEIRLVENVPAPRDDPPEKGRIVNLTAKREGVIERYEISSGRAMVDVGETVFPGQLLVAGYSEKETGLHPRVSSGKVYARTVIIKDVFVPYSRTVTVPSEPVVIGKSLNILGKEIFFYKKGRFLDGKYDIVKDEYRPTVFGVALPLFISSSSAVGYTVLEKPRTKEEAKKEAEELLLRAYAEEDAQIVRKEFHYIETEDGVRAVCQAECILDVAQTVEVM